MHDKLIYTAKISCTATLTSIMAWLGLRGQLALAWVIVMGLDYISGSAAAAKEGQWASSLAKLGFWHKAGSILVVAVAGIADLILVTAFRELQLGFAWPGCVLPLVLTWYILTELGSILENAVRLGAAVPSWLVKMLKISIRAVDTAGAAAAPDEKE